MTLTLLTKFFRKKMRKHFETPVFAYVAKKRERGDEIYENWPQSSVLKDDEKLI